MTSKLIKSLKECFVGETVVFYLKELNIPAVTESGEELSVNAMIDGFVVDIDEGFYYLGNMDGSIDKVISHDVIAIVEVANYEKRDSLDFDWPTEGEVH